LNPFQIAFEAVNTQADASKPAVKDVRISVDNDEISSTCTSTIGAGNVETTTCVFDKTTDVDKDSEIKFLLNISQYAKANETIKVTGNTSFGKVMLKKTADGVDYIGKYDDANEYALASDLIGSIDLNNIKVQTPKAALENTKSKTVEFVQGKSDTQTIFEGKYTAKKRDIYLNKFTATSTEDVADQLDNFDELSLNVIVNGNKVATAEVKKDGTKLKATEDFSKVLVEAGESAEIKVEAKAYPKAKTTANIEFKIEFAGEDKEGNEAGTADDTAAQFKAVEKGSLSVSDGTYETSKDFRNNSVSLKKSNATIAKFDLKPSKSSTEVDLDEFAFTIDPYVGADDSSNVRVKVGTNTSPTVSCSAAGLCKVTELDETVESNGITVEISTKGNAAVDEYTVTLHSVNKNTDTTSVLKTYTQFVMPVTVTFAQKDM
jgi:hypothetical protein